MTNWPKEIERENKRDTLEERSLPFFIIFWVIVALFVADFLHDEYKAKQDHHAMSEMVAQCANGKTVKFGDGSIMRCKVSEMVAQR